MGLRINQNIAAMNAYRNLSVTDGQMSKSLEKLSSGFRINRAADDAAGLAISEGLRAQTGGLKVAVRNAQDGVSVVQTAEGALTETHSILQRMRDLAVQASNEGSQGTDAQAAANTEYQALALELDDIANKTTFNGTALLDGTYDKAFQVGANSGEQLQVTIGDMKAATILTAVGDLTTTANAQTALDEHRHRDRDGLHGARRPRCGPEPPRAQDQQPQRRGGEPVRVGEPDPRHRHGLRDGRLHPLADPVPGRHRDAGPGEPGAAGCAASAPVMTCH